MGQDLEADHSIEGVVRKGEVVQLSLDHCERARRSV